MRAVSSNRSQLDTWAILLEILQCSGLLSFGRECPPPVRTCRRRWYDDGVALAFLRFSCTGSETLLDNGE